MRPGSSERGAGGRCGIAVAAAVVLGLAAGGAQAAPTGPAAVGRIVSTRAVVAAPAPVAGAAAARADAGGAAAVATAATTTPVAPVVTQRTASAHSAAAHTATIAGFAFHPASLTVTAGDTIAWTNEDAAQHTVTADDGSFDTGRLGRGASGSHTFTTAGTFAYHCAIHPFMKGTVTVVAASSGGSGAGRAGQQASPAGGGSASAGAAAGTASAPAAAPSAPSSAPATLPRTGWDPAGVAAAGAALLLAGLALRARTRPL
ncbi:MAG TPA: cupredoxin family copper-binding protein [Conexibacter sp.]|nr:cupredoxin family copper-binding protein [Conexibacter sp.]